MRTRDEQKNLTNAQVETMLMALDDCLDHKGVIGYAVARNYRSLLDSAQEYLSAKKSVIQQFGKPTDGNGTMISFEDPDAKSAVEDLGELAAISHDVSICMVPMKDAAEELTAKEIINLAWMLYEEGKDANL